MFGPESGPDFTHCRNGAPRGPESRPGSQKDAKMEPRGAEIEASGLQNLGFATENISPFWTPFLKCSCFVTFCQRVPPLGLGHVLDVVFDGFRSRSVHDRALFIGNNSFIGFLVIGVVMAVQDLVHLGSLAHSTQVRGQEESDRGHVEVFRILSDLSASSNRTSETSQRGGSFFGVLSLGSWNFHMLLSESRLVVILPGHVEIPV